MNHLWVVTACIVVVGVIAGLGILRSKRFVLRGAVKWFGFEASGAVESEPRDPP